MVFHFKSPQSPRVPSPTSHGKAVGGNALLGCEEISSSAPALAVELSITLRCQHGVLENGPFRNVIFRAMFEVYFIFERENYGKK